MFDINLYLQLCKEYGVQAADIQEGSIIVDSKTPEIDYIVETIWDELEDIPINLEDETLDEDFYIWEKGDDKYEDVWRWFDVHHSKGVAYLVNEYEGKD